MATEEIVRYVMSFLGGGMVVAVINWVKELRSAARQREVGYLQDQLRFLYGPLHCLTAQNLETFKRMERLQDALNLKLKVGPQEQKIPLASGAEVDKIVDLSNAYSIKCKEGLSIRVKQHLGEIYYVRPEFVDRVTARWTAKRERLGMLVMPHCKVSLKRRVGQKPRVAFQSPAAATGSVTMSKEGGIHVHHHHGRRDQRRRRSQFAAAGRGER